MIEVLTYDKKSGRRRIAMHDGHEWIVIPGTWITYVTHWQPLPEAPHD